MSEPTITIEMSSRDGSTLAEVLAGMELAGAEFTVPPDDGYESVFTDSVASLAGTTSAAFKNVVAKLRDFADTSAEGQIRITIDGVQVTLGELTDAQVEALLPS